MTAAQDHISSVSQSLTCCMRRKRLSVLGRPTHDIPALSPEYHLELLTASARQSQTGNHGAILIEQAV